MWTTTERETTLTQRVATEFSGTVLLNTETIRRQSRKIYDWAKEGGTHFSLNESALGGAADYAVRVIRHRYPSLEIPFFSRWRFFNCGDREARLADALEGLDPLEAARVRIELAVVSVLLDRGAGREWHYHEPDGKEKYGRTEGLALAAFDMFSGGLFSSDAKKPFRVDAQGLQKLNPADLERGFQISADNPMVGCDERRRLLASLGALLEERWAFFPEGRPGNLLDALIEQSGTRFRADTVFKAVLGFFGQIWPTRLQVGEFGLSDVWHHPALGSEQDPDAWIPFHERCLQLTFSLLEPLEAAGCQVTHIDELPGLADHRNGGLFLDSGVIVPRDPDLADQSYPHASETAVEWRALTIVFLDKIAEAIRFRLDLSDSAFPLVRLLEGGTWYAGRRLAAERRTGGTPPLRLDSDAVFF